MTLWLDVCPIINFSSTTHRNDEVGSTMSDGLDDDESLDDSSTDEVVSVFDVT